VFTWQADNGWFSNSLIDWFTVFYRFTVFFWQTDDGWFSNSLIDWFTVLTGLRCWMVYGVYLTGWWWLVQ
jgi:hypothetical protein